MPGVAVLVGLRVITDVLEDVDHGLVRELSLVELDGVDERPGVPTEILCQGRDEIRDRDWPDEVRRKVLVLEDSQGGSADPVAAEGWRDYTVRLVLAVVSRPDVGPSDYVASKYCEQAIINTLDRRLFHPAYLGTAGMRTNFTIEDCSRLDAPAIEQDLGIGKVLAAVRYELLIRHHRP